MAHICRKGTCGFEEVTTIKMCLSKERFELGSIGQKADALTTTPDRCLDETAQEGGVNRPSTEDCRRALGRPGRAASRAKAGPGRPGVRRRLHAAEAVGRAEGWAGRQGGSAAEQSKVVGKGRPAGRRAG